MATSIPSVADGGAKITHKTLLNWLACKVGMQSLTLRDISDGSILESALSIITNQFYETYWNYKNCKQVRKPKIYKVLKLDTKDKKRVYHLLKFVYLTSPPDLKFEEAYKAVLNARNEAIMIIESLLSIEISQYNSEKSTLLQNVNRKLDVKYRSTNFDSDWRDGIRLGALANATYPDKCIGFSYWTANNYINNIQFVLQEMEHKRIYRILSASDIHNMDTPEICIVAYISQFMKHLLNDTESQYVAHENWNLANNYGHERPLNYNFDTLIGTIPKSFTKPIGKRSILDNVFPEAQNDPDYANLDELESPTYEVLFDYDAAEGDEITLREGNIIKDVEKIDDGWWSGTVFGNKGLFPANFVKKTVRAPRRINPPPIPTLMKSASKVEDSEEKEKRKYSSNAEGLYDYESFKEKPWRLDVFKDFLNMDKNIEKNIMRTLYHADVFEIKKNEAPRTGHMSEVYQARVHTNNHGTIAVGAKAAKDTKFNIDIIKEAQMLMKIRHPNVISLVGLVYDNSRIYLLMPWMSKGDLKNYLTTNKDLLSLERKLLFALDVAKGMEHMYDLDYVHRDLAAQNCLLDKSMRIKISDFTLTKDTFQKAYIRQSDMEWGWQRASIESLMENIYTVKSDVWSYGMLLWEIITDGADPFKDMGLPKVSAFLYEGKRLGRPYQDTDNLHSLMVECWDKSPEKRPDFSYIINNLEARLKRLNQTYMARADLPLYVPNTRGFVARPQSPVVDDCEEYECYYEMP